MTTRTTLKTIVIALAALGTMASPAAFAAPSDNVNVEIDTRYFDTDWGVEKVYNALSAKAKSACSANGTRGFTNRKIERDCMSDLLEDFIEDVGHYKLTAYHASVVN